MGIWENIVGTKEQNETAQKNLDKQASEGSKLAKFLGGKSEPKEDAGSSARMRTETKSKDVIDKMSSADGMKKGGKVSSASKRADGIAIRGKTRA